MTAVAERARDAAVRPERGVVIARGTRVYLRTFTRGDLEHLAAWVDDPFLERMVGSEFLHAFKHDWDKAPAFDPIASGPLMRALRTELAHLGVLRSPE